MPFDNTQNDFALLEVDSNNLVSNIKEKDINNASLQSIVDSYKLYYADGESHTAKAKRYDLSYFVSFIINESGRKIPLVSDWTLQITKDFIDQRLASGDSPSTVNRRLATIKHLGRTLSERIPGFVNPAREAKSPKFDSTKPQGLNSEEITFLRKIARDKFEKDPNKFINLRNLVLLELLLGTGLRADEVRLLKISQIKEDFSWLTNVRTKGKKFREVYLHSELSELLKSYTNSLRQYILDHFPEYNQLPNKSYLQLPVFPSVKGSKVSNPSSYTMDPKTLWRIISAFGLSASYSPDFDSVNNKFPRIHPHKLRHSFAHGLLDSSQDIRLVAQALGHSDVRTTMRYTERSKDELRNAIEISNTKSKKIL